MKTRKTAFTLIELLIVVAIIAILAAIAVPNFLEAQTRAKVSRIKSDLRTLATALESYQVDWSKSAPEAGNGPFPAREIDGFTGQTGIVTPALSTPVSYITNSDLRDVFFQGSGSSAAILPDVRLFTYKAYIWEWTYDGKDGSEPIVYNEGSFLTGNDFQRHYGAWRLLSIGPDRDWDNKDNGSMYSSPSSIGLPYDPTNGTISLGSIVRSQAQGEQTTWELVNGQ